MSNTPSTPALDQPLTVDTFCAGLDALGYHRHGSSDSAGHGPTTHWLEPPTCVYWIERDSVVHVVDAVGSRILCGSDGDGWLIDGDPIDSLADALAPLACELEDAAGDGDV